MTDISGGYLRTFGTIPGPSDQTDPNNQLGAPTKTMEYKLVNGGTRTNAVVGEIPAGSATSDVVYTATFGSFTKATKVLTLSTTPTGTLVNGMTVTGGTPAIIGDVKISIVNTQTNLTLDKEINATGGTISFTTFDRTNGRQRWTGSNTFAKSVNFEAGATGLSLNNPWEGPEILDGAPYVYTENANSNVLISGSNGIPPTGGAGWSTSIKLYVDGELGMSTSLSPTFGGTGLSSYTAGDILYATGASTLTKLAIGSANQIIQVNSAGDGLEYTDKFLEASGGTLKVKSNTAYNYFQIKQDTSAAAGFQMTNEYSVTGTTQNAYLYLDPTTNNLNIETNGERIKFVNTDIKFFNSRDREMLFYDNSLQRLTLNNNGDFLFIQHCNLIEIDTSRRFMEHTPASNLITIGNPLDTISIVNGSATLSLPTSTGTLALSSQIPTPITNNNQLTNGAGYITASSSDTLTNKIISVPVMDSFRNSNNNFTIQYSDTTNSLIFGNNSDTSTAYNFVLESAEINTSVSGSAILDEDDLVSNSATKLATQQSIKSYVDTLKTKYDFSTGVSNGKLLIGNSAGNYSVNNLSAGSNITITNTSG